MKNNEIVLYMHAGSGNHGCEAIVNSLCRLLPAPAILMTSRAGEDKSYSLGELCSKIIQERSVEKNLAVHTWFYLKKRLLSDADCFMKYSYREICGRNIHKLNISIGGDNYCYDNMLDRLISSNRMLHAQGARTMLFGCSIEPSLLKRPDIVADMRLYDAVVARESITYEALLSAGVRENVFLSPDPAFLLPAENLPLPEGWEEGRMAGINLSPMLIENEKKPGITMKNYKALISHILDNTEMKVALIPHVVWENNDDRKPLAELYGAFRHTGRVVLIPDASASGLKGYIGRCRLFIGARTHATIAAYSSCVPTLAVGYSVKALGIARDLFGSEENYVLPVQRLEREEELIGAFEWLRERGELIRTQLMQVMPEYCSRAKQAGTIIRELWE